jgi:hypothetical protein
LKWGLLFDWLLATGHSMSDSAGSHSLSLTELLSHPWLCRSIKLLLAFASTVISGFSVHEIHDQDIVSALDMYVFQNGASYSTKALRFLHRSFSVSIYALSRRSVVEVSSF